MLKTTGPYHQVQPLSHPASTWYCGHTCKHCEMLFHVHVMFAYFSFVSCCEQLFLERTNPRMRNCASSIFHTLDRRLDGEVRFKVTNPPCLQIFTELYCSFQQIKDFFWWPNRLFGYSSARGNCLLNDEKCPRRISVVSRFAHVHFLSAMVAKQHKLFASAVGRLNENWYSSAICIPVAAHHKRLWYVHPFVASNGTNSDAFEGVTPAPK